MFGIGAAINQSRFKHDWPGLPVAESHRVPMFALADPAMQYSKYSKAMNSFTKQRVFVRVAQRIMHAMS